MLKYKIGTKKNDQKKKMTKKKNDKIKNDPKKNNPKKKKWSKNIWSKVKYLLKKKLNCLKFFTYDCETSCEIL